MVKNLFENDEVIVRKPDENALYIVEVTGIAKIPYLYMSPWKDSENKKLQKYIKATAIYPI